MIVPYINSVCESSENDTPAMIIMDNFKGQDNKQVCLLPPNTTEWLQLLDISISQHAFQGLSQEEVGRVVIKWDYKAASREGHRICRVASDQVGDAFAERAWCKVDGGDGRILRWESSDRSQCFLKAGIAVALDGHIDSRPEEENVRNDESDSEEYDCNPDGDSSVMDLTDID